MKTSTFQADEHRAPPRQRWPNFFIVGAPRCGTTALFSYLRRHPEVFLPPSNKEPHFFAPDLDSGSEADGTFFVRSERDYLALFEEASEAKSVGEASTLYLYSRMAASRIRRECEQCRIIIMIRDPVELMYSFHSHRLRQGYETIADFGAALEAEEDRKRGSRIPPGCKVVKALFYRELADLVPQIERYLELFNRQNVKFIVHDDLVASSAEVYRGVLDFLGVDADFQPEFKRVNAHKEARSSWLQELRNNTTVLRVGRRLLPQSARRRLVSALYAEKSRPGMDPDLRNRLTAEFAPKVERLSELIGRDLTGWSAG